MAPKPDVIDWFFSLSLFKQLFAIMLLGPLAASTWALIDDWKRPWAVRAAEQATPAGDPPAGTGSERETRRAA